MTSAETQKVVDAYFEVNNSFLERKSDRQLSINNTKYFIRPDEAIYFPNQILAIEYENQRRPAESVTKYYWLFKNTEWMKENIKINLLLILNNPRSDTGKQIRAESCQLLGELLMEKYPELIRFYMIRYKDLSKECIFQALDGFGLHARS